MVFLQKKRLDQVIIPQESTELGARGEDTLSVPILLTRTHKTTHQTA